MGVFKISILYTFTFSGNVTKRCAPQETHIFGSKGDFMSNNFSRFPYQLIFFFLIGVVWIVFFQLYFLQSALCIVQCAPTVDAKPRRLCETVNQENY